MSSNFQNPTKIRINETLAKQLCTQWVETFSISDAGEPLTPILVLKDILAFLKTWPRGNEAGQFLPSPLPLEQKDLKSCGIKLSWLHAAWNTMLSKTQFTACSTRMFVELLVRPLLAETNTETLLEYVPPAFRSTHPHVFICHPWDGFFRHILFFPDSLKKNWPADSAVWIDCFCLPQLDEGPNAPDLAEEIKQVIHSIGTTVAVFPGDDRDEFALLPVMRTWCVFEMMCTNKEQLLFRVGLHGNLDDVEFHKRILNFIDQLQIQQCKASYESDHNFLFAELLRDFPEPASGSVFLQQCARNAFAVRYEQVPLTPTLVRSLSGSLHNSSRVHSLSDVYNSPRAASVQQETPTF